MRRWLTRLTVGALIFVAVEVAVLAALIWRFGFALVLVLALIKCVAGGVLVRREGARGWRRFRAAVRSEHPPGQEVTHAVVGLVASILILIGGVLSALLGALALVPPVRRWVAARVQRFIERRLAPGVAGGFFGPRRVRARRIRVRRQPGGPDPAAGASSGVQPPQRPPVELVKPADATGDAQQVVEGEIIPPSGSSSGSF